MATVLNSQTAASNSIASYDADHGGDSQRWLVVIAVDRDGVVSAPSTLTATFGATLIPFRAGVHTSRSNDVAVGIWALADPPRETRAISVTGGLRRIVAFVLDGVQVTAIEDSDAQISSADGAEQVTASVTPTSDAAFIVSAGVGEAEEDLTAAFSFEAQYTLDSPSGRFAWATHVGPTPAAATDIQYIQDDEIGGSPDTMAAAAVVFTEVGTSSTTQDATVVVEDEVFDSPALATFQDATIFVEDFVSIGYVDGRVHERAALARIPSQFANSPNLLGTVEVIGRRFDAISRELTLLRLGRMLDNAVGVQLDEIGRLVGLPRGPRLDARYRRALRVRMLAHRSTGTEPEFSRAVAALWPGVTFSVAQHGVLGARVRVTGADSAYAADDHALLQPALAPGVGLTIEYL